ncbi:MAG: glutamate racemase [Lentisphaeria bacterium]|jgi:glutamate racemase
MNMIPKILVFDSGAGGLSVAKEIVKKGYSCELIYAADNRFFPYGTKSDTVLTSRIIEQLGLHINEFNPDVAVVACNTASTLALDSLRRDFDCPFVGVVPAVKPAASLTISGTIGMLATPATVDRDYTRALISQFASQHKILLHGSNRLVELAEGYLAKGRLDYVALELELMHLLNQTDGHEIDTIVLACTHFPLLKLPMSEILLRKRLSIQWVDSGEAVARRVFDLLFDEPARTHKTEIKLNPITTSLCTFKFLFSSEEEKEDLTERYYHYLIS